MYMSRCYLNQVKGGVYLFSIHDELDGTYCNLLTDQVGKDHACIQLDMWPLSPHAILEDTMHSMCNLGPSPPCLFFLTESYTLRARSPTLMTIIMVW